MKVAFCYRGEYYRKQFRHRSKENFDRSNSGSNFFNNIDNHLEYIFSKFTDYDVFLHTYSYNESFDQKLLNALKPKKYIIEKQRQTTISHSIIESSKIVDTKYDFIFNLRYDMFFLKNVSEFKIDYDLFNFAFKDRAAWGVRKCTSDLFYGFKGEFLNDFICASKDTYPNCPVGSLHLLYNKLEPRVGEKNINFMIDGSLSSYNDVDQVAEQDYFVINRKI